MWHAGEDLMETPTGPGFWSPRSIWKVIRHHFLRQSKGTGASHGGVAKCLTEMCQKQNLLDLTDFWHLWSDCNLLCRASQICSDPSPIGQNQTCLFWHREINRVFTYLNFISRNVWFGEWDFYTFAWEHYHLLIILFTQ